jgi:poly(hydroxyalkanoate) granule-associated protein
MTTKKSAQATEAPRTAGLVQDSAQQIWLAGLGAFAKAQEEGTKAFQGLVKEGLSLQRQTKAAAEEKLAEASRKFSTLAEVSTGLTSGMGAGLSSLGAKAAQPWDKLESIFEERVAKALAQLGIPSAAELTALRAEVQTLKQQVAALKPAGKAPAKTATKAKVAAKTPAKAPAKKAKVQTRSVG